MKKLKMNNLKQCLILWMAIILLESTTKVQGKLQF